jgi:hypothetical protein
MMKSAIVRGVVAGGEVFESMVDPGIIEARSETRTIGLETRIAVIYTSETVQYRIQHPLRIGLSVEG